MPCLANSYRGQGRIGDVGAGAVVLDSKAHAPGSGLRDLEGWEFENRDSQVMKRLLKG